MVASRYLIRCLGRMEDWLLCPLQRVKRATKWMDDAGNAVPSQRLSTGELAFWASDVPALGSRHYRVVEGDAVPGDTCKLDGYTLDNGCVRVTIDGKTGTSCP